ncbi:Uncharacterized protein MCHI_002946 [Candidatus Magnetoovum chiemensis]|nr:Uncharacterized protein MCHI_002946 [Candidatus Magnetoovum chiemensis]
MATQLVLTFPQNFPDKLSQDKEFLEKAKELIVMEALREEEISQGMAASLLGINRWDFPLLMAKHGIPLFDYSYEEWQEELKAVERIRKALNAEKDRRRSCSNKKMLDT